MEIVEKKKCDGSTQKTRFTSPWKHGDEWRICKKSANARQPEDGVSYGFVRFDESDKLCPVLFLQKDKKVESLFLSMLVRTKTNEDCEEVNFDPEKGQFNILAQELQDSEDTDEDVLRKLAEHLVGRTLVCDRKTTAYKDLNGKKKVLTQFYTV